MKDYGYELRVMNSKIYGMRDAMVSNAKVFNEFSADTKNDIGQLRRRVTYLERGSKKWKFIVFGLLLEDIRWRWKCYQILEKKKKDLVKSGENWCNSEDNLDENSENS